MKTTSPEILDSTSNIFSSRLTQLDKRIIRETLILIHHTKKWRQPHPKNEDDHTQKNKTSSPKQAQCILSCEGEYPFHFWISFALHSFLETPCHSLTSFVIPKHLFFFFLIHYKFLKSLAIIWHSFSFLDILIP